MKGKAVKKTRWLTSHFSLMNMYLILKRKNPTIPCAGIISSLKPVGENLALYKSIGLE